MNFNFHDLQLMLPEDVLLGATCAILLIDLFIKPSQRAITHWLSLLAVVGTLILILVDHDATTIAFGGAYIHDGIAAVLKIFILGVTAVVFVYAKRYLVERGLFIGEYYLLCLFATLGMMLLVSAGSLVMAYLGLELFALSTYALVAINRDSSQGSEAAMKYFVLGALASGLLLYGMSMIYGATGTLDLARNPRRRVVRIGRSATCMCCWLFGARLSGRGHRRSSFGAAPFHMWLPDVYRRRAHGRHYRSSAAAPKIAVFGMAYRLLEGGHGRACRQHWHELMLGAMARRGLARGRQHRRRSRRPTSSACWPTRPFRISVFFFSA